MPRNEISNWFKMSKENARNKRVVGRASQCSLFESYDSNGWSVCFWRDRSDPAAHAKH
jgi:hypothetical protein